MAVTAAVRVARTRWWSAVAAWALWMLTMLGLAAVLWMDRLLRQAGRPDLVQFAQGGWLPSLAALSAATVGAVLASRRPRHPVGWLLLVLAVSLGVAGAAGGYVYYGLLARPGALPAASSVALYVPATVVVALITLGFVLLLTPTGSLPSPRWRWWSRVTAATPVGLLLVVAFAPKAAETPRLVTENPLDLRGLGGAVLVANQMAFAVAILAVVVAAWSLVVRFRRARGIERQQLRWVALAAVLMSLAFVVVVTGLAMGSPNLAGWAAAACLTVMPVAIGAAILRYRLYDLDRIISRTLAYGLLTVLLGGGYALVVLGLGQLLGRESSLVVAAATLAVAAMFQPVRHRVQTAVDRRFNRRRHDAARIIEAFGARLRNQVDLDSLTAELLAAVDQTMQPTQASLWLRPQGPSNALADAVGPRTHH
jgi:hypothetical protein